MSSLNPACIHAIMDFQHGFYIKVSLELYRERRMIKMVDYSQFEASTKSGIHADPGRIRKNDEIIGKVLKQRKSSKIYCVLCVLLAAGSFFIHWIITVVFGLAALFFLWRGTGKISDDYLKEVYEEGVERRFRRYGAHQ